MFHSVSHRRLCVGAATFEKTSVQVHEWPIDFFGDFAFWLPFFEAGDVLSGDM